MAYTFTRTGAQIEEIHNTVEDPKSNTQFSDGIRTIAGEYRGLWPGTGGSANKGDTYQTQVSGTPTGQYFTALQNTTVDPVGDDVNWRVVVSNQSLGGLTNYQAASVADMIAGKAWDQNQIALTLGQYWSSGGTDWNFVSDSLPVTEDNFRAFSVLNINDIAGIDRSGANDNTAAYVNAVNIAKTNGLAIYFPHGTYKGDILIDSTIKVFGDGQKSTFLSPASASSTCITIEDTASGTLTHSGVSKLSIVSTIGGTGLRLGGSGSAGAGILGQGRISELHISGFDLGIFHSACLTYVYDTVYIEDCNDAGVEFKTEGPNTTCTFINLRVRQCPIGVNLFSLQVAKFIGCNFESNLYRGIVIRSSPTNTATLLNFDSCWFENNGHDPIGGGGVVGQGCGVSFDIQSALSSTLPHNIKFDNCIFSSPTGERDISIDRTRQLIFENCAFTEFTSEKLYFTTGTGITNVNMIQCSKFKEKPTEAMYANFPALYSDGKKGIFYEFTDDENNRYTNKLFYSNEVITIDNTTSPTGLNLRGVKTVICDTASGDITLTSVAGLEKGQAIDYVKDSAKNSLTFTHSAASQGYLLPNGSSLVVTDRSSNRFISNGLTSYKSV